MSYIGNQSGNIVYMNLNRFNGTVADLAALTAVTGASSGDMYKVEDSGLAYMYDGTQWVDTGPIVGPQGTKGDNGTGITSVVRTLGDGSEGTVDTYTITYDDASTSTFEVRNGSAGTIDHIAKTGTVGTTDTYTAYADAAETQPLGSFEVRNGGVAGLGDLVDVDTTTAPEDGQGLVFNQGLGLWVPGTVASGGGAIKPSIQTGSVSGITGTSLTVAVDVLAFGSVGKDSLSIGATYREVGETEWLFTDFTQINGLGEVLVNVGGLSISTEYEVAGVARDLLNPEIEVIGSIVNATTMNVFIKAPSITVEGSPNDVGETPTITVSPFSVSGGSDTYVRSEVKVFQNGVEIWSNLNVVIGSPWTWVLPASILVENTSGYRVDVRHIGQNLGAGLWGQSSVFSTKEIFFDGLLPAGTPYGGGYYAGANIIVGGVEYALVVAPKAQGGESATTLQWKTETTATSGTDSTNDGWSNSNAMNNTAHPAARFCRTLNINGHNDWYFPSQDELEICYRYLKPTNHANDTSYGANSSSNPPGANYTAGNPVQTSISIFQSEGTEAFKASTYWTSTQISATQARHHRLHSGVGTGDNPSKVISHRVRAVRRVAL